MKKCQICGREAHVFLTQLVNGEATDLCLCEYCAKERGFFDPRSLSANSSIFPENLKQKVDELMRELGQQHDLSSSDFDHFLSRAQAGFCPACAFPFELAHMTDRMGCPECYKHKPNSQKLSKHTTELEDSLSDTPQDIDQSLVERIQIEKDMQSAAEREDYEEAARLRDLLNNLESSS